VTAVAAAKKAPLIKVTSGPMNARTDPESGLRFYTWNGEEYPSVTSIRNLAGMPFKLNVWRTNQVIDRAMTKYDELGKLLAQGTDPKTVAAWLRKAADEKRDAAANLGTRVHDHAAAGTTLDKAPADVAPFLMQYRHWLAETGIEILLVERQVWNEEVGYAGTFDLIGRFPKTGKCWMIDLKTGSGVYPEHAFQLEAYRRAEFIGENDVIDQDATRILAEVTGQAILHLSATGWTFKVIPPSDKTWRAFRGLLLFANWAYLNQSIDGLISASMTGAGGNTP
jgi:hypothetical protein